MLFTKSSSLDHVVPYILSTLTGKKGKSSEDYLPAGGLTAAPETAPDEACSSKKPLMEGSLWSSFRSGRRSGTGRAWIGSDASAGSCPPTFIWMLPGLGAATC